MLEFIIGHFNNATYIMLMMVGLTQYLIGMGGIKFSLEIILTIIVIHIILILKLLPMVVNLQEIIIKAIHISKVYMIIVVLGMEV